MKNHHNYLFLLLFWCCGLAATTGYSQSRISGTVKTIEGDPLPGVNVLIKGTSQGTTTDLNGTYTLSAPSNTTLIFSFIGYLNQEVSVGNRSTVDVTLEEDIQNLEQVVVVGYGTVKKSDLTGSVASVKAASFKDIPVTTVDQALQGRAAGVQITQASAAPGGGLSVRVRGANSLISGSEPLYVIDGLPIYPDNGSFGTGGNRQPTNALASINPNDIESIEVLKDASATSIYGSRGANGVVLITTKRGKEGSTNVTFENSYSIQTLARNIDVLSASDYARYLNTLDVSQGGSPRYTDAQVASFGQGTNWMDEILRQGSIWNNQLTVTGGNTNARYAVMGNYQNNQGLIENTYFKRYSLRMNLDNDLLNGRATLSNSWSLARTTGNNVPTDRGGPGGIIITALGLDPTVPVYDENGNYNYPLYDGRFTINPVAEAKEGVDRDATNRFFGTSALTINLTKDLKFRTSVGADLLNATRNTFYNSKTRLGRQYGRELQRFDRNLVNILNENILTYGKSFGESNLEVTVGYTYQKENNVSAFQSVRGLDSDDFMSLNFQNGTSPQIGSSSRIGWVLKSFLGRVNYNFRDRYLLTLTARRDGSSKFGLEKWATFPSAALGWRVVNERFFESSGLDNVFDELKVRLSYGVTGNSQIPAYQSSSDLSPRYYIFNNQLVSGYAATRLPNPGLKWEQTGMFNAGLDMGFLRNRLSVSVDYFRNRTTDLLLYVSIPQSTGFGTILKNTGSLTNKGLEVAVDGKVVATDKFSWDLSANVSILRNRIEDLGSSTPFFASSPSGHLGIDGSWVEAGYPIGIWRGYHYIGVDEGGNPQYEDLNDDGAYTADDYKIIGNPNPNFIWGLNSTVRYGGFDLVVFLRGVQGNDVRNLQQSEIGDGAQKINQIANILTDSWTPNNPNASRPAADAKRDFASFRRSSFFIEDGSFIRLQNIALGYNLPASKVFRTVRLYVSAQNLFVITKYTGFDPEVNNQGQNNLNRGDDYDAYPRARTFTAGFNLGF
ncbi:TonB-linked outer membrane protein, SusC/RagA family [Catalinimonas alkaloidigena]|uniref:TonB-linked outer membrane protein, SusC/RagA family n=1 Tax=Catalinimonas alkaloidigena TaxID=1075417 RepID=A0A1G8Y6F9_9BACT|nr:TonB-dependent receptor [Catalinimonas alkaloidigena]SDJ98341.1 TonB-linked outer membrane protein, SusC/RagA family [Catalinimonas alkaloidigena]